MIFYTYFLRGNYLYGYILSSYLSFSSIRNIDKLQLILKLTIPSYNRKKTLICPISEVSWLIILIPVHGLYHCDEIRAIMHDMML